VLVLEQWSDEATYYVWYGATYTPGPGNEAHQYSDFTFSPGGNWPDPRGMVADAHRRGVRIVLWQIAALQERFPANSAPHYPTTAPQQLLNDKQYAVEQRYVVDDGSGRPYRIPSHIQGWFGESMVPDFTKATAVTWWMSKRAHLIDDVGIDGFKLDGGEAIFGRDTAFADGRRGDVMHNGFPSVYIGAYNQFVHDKLHGSGTTFSRAGTAGAQALSIYWAGDQLSTFEGFQEAIRAGLSAGWSGVSFWGWDLAGFAGDFPTSELYLRATAMATFCPIMQLHSQWAAQGDSMERTPWHIQQVTGDPSVVPTFQKFANIRMNLLPYLYSEARTSAQTGTPMLRAMDLEFPGDPRAAGHEQQYMFGDQLLVAPIAAAGATVKDVYVPGGEWYDFWYSAQFSGPRTKVYGVPLYLIPVYARPARLFP
jgi:alpha-glucosidase (family GH31 glycosyl hydrolase)